MKLNKLYTLALAEGEGLGTAYEYFVKLRLLKKILNNNNKIKTVLIYGLPEKYGFSLDFLYFCKRQNIRPDLYEPRKNKLNKLYEILNDLNQNKKIVLKFNQVTKLNKKYDLILSGEVLQSLNEDELRKYNENIKLYGQKTIIFTPNKNNKAHNKISKLNSYSIKGLKKLFKNNKLTGFIDNPPFPPGIKAKKKITSKLFIFILQIFASLEFLIPKFIRKKTSHIVYVYLKK